VTGGDRAGRGGYGVAVAGALALSRGGGGRQEKKHKEDDGSHIPSRDQSRDREPWRVSC
jgi:hypothetical protein